MSRLKSAVLPQFGLPTSATLQSGAWFGAFRACAMTARLRRAASGVDFDALRLEQAQREHGLADQHGQRLAAARAAAQQLHRLAGQEAELAEPAQGDRVDFRRRGDDARHGRACAVGQRAERPAGRGAHHGKAILVMDCK